MERTVENVKRLIAEGKNVSKIAEVFGITYTPMRMWMKKHGLQTKGNRRTWTDTDLKDDVRNNKTLSIVIHSNLHFVEKKEPKLIK